MVNTELLNKIKKIESGGGAKGIPNVNMTPFKQTFISQGEQSTRDKIRGAISKVPFISEALTGTFDTMFGTGQQFFDVNDRSVVEDRGTIGQTIDFFRPFGVGKIQNEKFFDRYNKLVESGIDKDRAQKISYTYLDTPSKDITQRMFDRQKKDEERKQLALTPEEKKAIRGVNIEESLDKVFGALDVLSVGSTKPVTTALKKLTKEAIEKMAKTGSKKVIRETLEEAVPEIAKNQKISDSVIEAIRKTKDTRDVKRAISLGLEDINKVIKNQDVFDVKQAITKKKVDLGDGAKNLDVLEDTSRISQRAVIEDTVDDLIAKNRVRIVRRGDEDVYQFKNLDGEFKTARGEDDAVRRAIQVDNPTAIRSSKGVELSEDLELRKLQLEVKEDAINNSPFKSPKNKHFVDREGRVLELGDLKGGKVSQILEDRIAESGVKDPTKFREGLEDFLNQKAQLALEKKELRKAITEYKKGRVGELTKEAIQNKKAIGERFPETQKSKIQKAIQQKGEIKTLDDIQRGTSPKGAKGKGQSTKDYESILQNDGDIKSLDLIAREEALEKLPENLVESASLPKMIEQNITPVQKKVHALDYMRTPNRVLQKLGLQKEATFLRRQYDKYLIELPKNIDKVTEWSKRVPKESNERIFKYLDGQAITLNDEELKVAGEIKQWLEQWADRLKLPKDDRIAEYITHIFDDQLIQKEFDEDLAKIIRDKIPSSVYNPFLEKRLGAKGYVQDTWRALDAYVKRATRKVHMDPAIERLEDVASTLEESQWDFVKKYVDRINMRPTAIDNLFDNLLKNIPFVEYKLGQRPTLQILRSLRQWTYRGLLGANISSALRNTSQGINTYAKLGEKWTAIGYSKLLNSGSRKELVEQGVLNSGFIEDRVLTSGKKAMANMDKALFFFFENAERINRGSAYFGAKAKALKEGKSLDEAIEAGKKMVADTQFLFDPIDQPQFLGSEGMKTLFQLQSFTIKQTEFMAEMIKNKDVMGLFRYALGGTIFIATLGKAFGMEPEELIPAVRIGSPPSLTGFVELGKAVANAPDRFGNERTTGEKAKDVGKAFSGLLPASAQIRKTYQGINAVNTGGSFTQSGNLQFEIPNTTGSKIQAVLFGKYANKNAKEYFNRVDDSAKERKKLLPVYEEAQKLLNDGKEQEAQILIDNLSDEEYEVYKDIRTARKAERTLEGKKRLLPTYQKVQKLVSEGKEAEAQAIVDELTDEEYEYYEAVKKSVSDNAKATNGERAEFGSGQIEADRSIITTVLLYAKALALDPETAFKTMFTEERLRYVGGNAVIMERLSLKESQAVREERANGRDLDNLRLDHFIPLQLGGDNSEENLLLVPEALWASYTPVENHLGRLLRDKKIKEDEAVELITKFKNGEISAESVLNR